MKHLLYSLLMISLFSGCSVSENIYYEQFEDVNPQSWKWEDAKKFEFEVTDSSHLYNLFCGLRIDSDYNYSNIWLIYVLRGPDGYMRKDQFQVVLSDNFGKWKGEGVSNLISYRTPFIKNQQLKKGKYTLEIFQNMRDESLEHVNNVGLQILKGQLILENK